MLPGFTEDGVLPPGDYEMTMEALATSRLVTGDGAACENWDKEWRAVLVGNLEVLVRQLWQVGIERVFADGSFVEDKAHPHDIDGYFECDTAYLLSGQLAADLNAIDPYKVWTWAPNSRRPDPKFSKVSVACCLCGTPITWSYTRTCRGQPAASQTSTVTSWSFPRRFVNRETGFYRRESSGFSRTETAWKEQN